jgi:competence protein ComEC
VVTIANLGGAPQSMTGWTLVSEVGGQSFRFPDGFTLAPGAAVLVTSGPNGYLAPPVVLQWLKSDGTPSGGYVWNNDGDPAALRDAAGSTVSRFP